MSSCMYFAYGSNLLYARLQVRTPSLKNLGIGRLNNHKMDFALPGGDGSGKCGILKTAEGSYVIGVLYQLDFSEKPILDKIESFGYLYEHLVEVEHRGKMTSSFTYYPTDMSDRLLPYDWYKNFVL